MMFVVHCEKIIIMIHNNHTLFTSESILTYSIANISIIDVIFILLATLLITK